MAADGTQPEADWTQAEAEWTQPNAEFWAPQRNAVDASFAMQPAVYADEDFFAAEQERLFGRAWVAVALAEQVALPGRLLVRSVGGRSVLLTRSDGGLHGFLNSCRHRGTELAERDCDIANTIRCPYHRWHYSADGQLVSAPLFDEVPRDDFDVADYGLVPVRTEAWGPLVFVCLSEDTPPLEKWLGDLPDRLAAYQFAEWRSTGLEGVAGTFDVAANWKLIVENFAEYYHLPWVHPELAKVSRVPDHYRYQGPGMYCGQTTTPVSGDERDDWLTLPAAAGLDDSDVASGRFVALFPNVTLAVLPSHMFLMVLQPLAAGRTLEHCTFLFPPGPMTAGEPSAELREAFETTHRFWIEVNDEDIDICERAQRGISLGGAPPGPLAPRFEEPVNRFHKMTADLMTLPSTADLVVPAGDRPGGVDLYGSNPNPLPPAIESAEAASTGKTSHS